MTLEHKLDGLIAFIMALWIMKLDLSYRYYRRKVERLEYMLQDLAYQSVEYYRHAYPEVSTVYRENDVPTTRDRGKFHGAGEAMGDEAEGYVEPPTIPRCADHDERDH